MIGTESKKTKIDLILGAISMSSLPHHGVLAVGTENEGDAEKDDYGEEQSVGVEFVESHGDAQADGNNGLDIGIDARCCRGDATERVVEQKIRQIGRHKQYKERGKKNLCIHIAKVDSEHIVDTKRQNDKCRGTIYPA